MLYPFVLGITLLGLQPATSVDSGEETPPSATDSALPAQATPDTAADSSVTESATPAPTPAATIPTEPAPPRDPLVDRILEMLRSRKPAQRGKAAVALAALEDERVLDALSYIAEHDNSRQVAFRAIELLGAFKTAASYEALRHLTKTRRREHAEHVLKVLGDLQDPLAAQVLLDLVWDKTIPSRTRHDATTILRQRYPAFAANKKLPAVSGNVFVPIIGGALFGAETLRRVGILGQSADGPGVGFWGGLLIGGGSGYLLSPALTKARSQYYITALTWGLGLGHLSSRAILRDNHSDYETYQTILELTGELTMLGASYYGADHLDLNTADVVVANLGGLTGLTLSTGILGFMPIREDKRPGFATLVASGLTGLTAAAFGSKHLTFTQGDATLTGLGALEGAWYGGFLTDIYDRDRQDPRIDAGILTGGSLGLLGAAAVSQFTDLSPPQVLQVAGAGVYGKLLGTGLALLAKASPDTGKKSMLAMGALGLGSAAYLKDDVHVETADVALVPIASFIGAAHGSGISFWLQAKLDAGLTEDQIGGLALTSFSLFGIGAAVAGQLIPLSTWEVTMGSVGWMWGLWFSGWSFALFDYDDPNAILFALLTADLGLVGSSLLVSPMFGMDPRILAGASIGGMGAAAIAVVITALATEDFKTLVATNLVASAAGIVAGAWVSQAVLGSSWFRNSRLSSGSASLGGNSELPIRLQAIGAQPNIRPDGTMDGVMVNAAFSLN